LENLLLRPSDKEETYGRYRHQNYCISYSFYFSMLPSVVPDTGSALTGNVKELTAVTAGGH